MPGESEKDQPAQPKYYEITRPSLISVLLVIAILATLFIAFGPIFRPRPSKRILLSACMNNVRQMIIDIQLYQQDHDLQFPDKATIWTNINFPTKSLTCPTYGEKKGIGYGYNASLSTRSLEDAGMPEAQLVPVLADSATPSHLLYTSDDIDFRHTDRAMVGFADGHVVLLAPEKVPPLSPAK